MKLRRNPEIPAGPVAVLATLLMLMAIGADSAHLAAHARDEHPADLEEICTGAGGECHARENHLHRGPPPRQSVCVACLWHGMGKTPPPAAEPLPRATEVSPAPAAPAASARSFEGLAARSRAPPSA